jgi:hypothetical protein
MHPQLPVYSTIEEFALRYDFCSYMDEVFGTNCRTCELININYCTTVPNIYVSTAILYMAGQELLFRYIDFWVPNQVGSDTITA